MKINMEAIIKNSGLKELPAIKYGSIWSYTKDQVERMFKGRMKAFYKQMGGQTCGIINMGNGEQQCVYYWNDVVEVAEGRSPSDW